MCVLSDSDDLLRAQHHALRIPTMLDQQHRAINRTHQHTRVADPNDRRRIEHDLVVATFQRRDEFAQPISVDQEPKVNPAAPPLGMKSRPGESFFWITPSSDLLRQKLAESRILARRPPGGAALVAASRNRSG